MSRPIPGAGRTSDLADWLPLLGSIVRALSGMAEDDRIVDDRFAGRSRLAEYG